MVEIEYNGGNAVNIATKKTKIYIDAGSLGVPTAKSSPKNNTQLTSEDRFVDEKATGVTLNGPGEYEVGDFSIQGFAAQRHLDAADLPKSSAFFAIQAADLRVAYVGNVAPGINEQQQEGIGMVDVLIIPVGGGGYTLDAVAANAVIKQLEPRVIIPVHYADDSLLYEVPQEDFESISKVLGAPVESMPKAKIKTAAALPPALTVWKLDVVR